MLCRGWRSAIAYLQAFVPDNSRQLWAPLIRRCMGRLRSRPRSTGAFCASLLPRLAQSC